MRQGRMRRLAGSALAVWALAASGCATTGGPGRAPESQPSSGVSVQKDAQGHWQLLVDGAPYMIHGITYTVSKVGQTPEGGDPVKWPDWVGFDYNGNGKSDGPYDAWVDVNRNDIQGPDEPAVGDFKLLQEMGANTIRWYHNGYHRPVPPQKLFRDLFKTYGIRVAVGDFFGAYTIGSGAAWTKGTDYTDLVQRKKMLESVKRMVKAHRNEPYVLMWLLGNENNLDFANTNASSNSKAYASLLNEAAELIRKLDPRHPVALVNGEVDMIEPYNKYAPAIDIFGVNAYRGPRGFSDLWYDVKMTYDRPVMITEYGQPVAVSEDDQAAYHRGCWQDIEAQRAGGSGAGNSIGGFAFEWLDLWWKAGEPDVHAQPHTTGYQGTGEMNWSQEYYGFAAQGDGRHSPFERQLRKVYDVYKNELWHGQH